MGIEYAIHSYIYTRKQQNCTRKNKPRIGKRRYKTHINTHRHSERSTSFSYASTYTIQCKRCARYCAHVHRVASLYVFVHVNCSLSLCVRACKRARSHSPASLSLRLSFIRRVNECVYVCTVCVSYVSVWHTVYACIEACMLVCLYFCAHAYGIELLLFQMCTYFSRSQLFLLLVRFVENNT